ncbi:MAG: ribose 5-phosphate isomerase B [Desulfobulbaceae bacterium]|jgi:ribose 5-phosphate isomerase B|nr:ribose 5-phosphate isomerase B [Desulfobulbaceae bacterium]HKJ14036.1 ribose 5-phosphate isomerase B [Desulfobulbales bacterium]MDH3542070.1 ribose 5-phosphate isomerase B [Desulfobulbaceae bacterium]MDH3775780.1 ribose 5-phosphate isomerase B [Desulfobulbaceae bacterium]MDH3782087.1 ribose 5-phosphate isomerase B [Desulfobulbaceae bacterium]
MIIALGSDHRGVPLKKYIVDAIESSGNRVLDLGTFDETPVDYPDYAKSVAEALVGEQAQRGVLLCGSGVGACVAANKIAGIRACLCHDTYSAHQGVEHDDMNILCLGARVIGPALAVELVESFLRARFSGEARHRRRLGKIAALEKTSQT